MAIIWRDKMSVGNSIIDDQHRYLICLMNTIEIALRNDDDRDILQTAVEQLFEYTEYHFAQEEQIQLKIKYPKAVEHKEEHQKILVDLLAIKKQVDALLKKSSQSETLEVNPTDEISDSELNQLLEDDDTDTNSADLTELTTLMRHWVLDHVLGRDREMCLYLRKLPPTFS